MCLLFLLTTLWPVQWSLATLVSKFISRGSSRGSFSSCSFAILGFHSRSLPLIASHFLSSLWFLGTRDVCRSWSPAWSLGGTLNRALVRDASQVHESTHKHLWWMHARMYVITLNRYIIMVHFLNGLERHFNFQFNIATFDSLLNEHVHLLQRMWSTSSHCRFIASYISCSSPIFSIFFLSLLHIAAHDSWNLRLQFESVCAFGKDSQISCHIVPMSCWSIRGFKFLQPLIRETWVIWIFSSWLTLVFLSLPSLFSSFFTFCNFIVRFLFSFTLSIDLFGPSKPIARLLLLSHYRAFPLRCCPFPSFFLFPFYPLHSHFNVFIVSHV